MRARIRALREAAKRSSPGTGETDAAAIRAALTSNMLAGFALELGLKLFSMTFRGRPARGHDLAELYGALPGQIQGDIAEAYLGALSEHWPIRMYALRASEEPPPTPEGVTATAYDSGANLFESASMLFVQGRYFFERVGSEDWAMIDHPIEYLLLMSEVIDAVYDGYIRRGGWR